MRLFLVLVTIYLLFILGMNRDRGLNAPFYRVSSFRLFTRQQFGMYLLYVIALTIAGAVVLRKVRFSQDSLAVKTVLLALLYAPVAFYRPSMNVYYTKNEAEVFRQKLPRQNGVNQYLTMSSYQTTMMPFYKDEARTQLIGKLYSSGEIYEDQIDKQNEVIQYTTYVFNGSDPAFPAGTVVMSLSNKNNIHDIFPPDNVYRGHILTGSGAYEGIKGTVDVNITGDKRMAVFTH